ncbi:MAG: DUF6445 family protein [Woeseiaceae bacterium]|nr:DUF6445 family protein [Woeseiaceae bacterium]
MMKSLIVIDDLLDNPLELREVALGMNYPESSKPTTYPGRNSETPLLADRFDKLISEIVGESLVRAPGVVSGHFRIALEGDTGTANVHIDIAHWTTVLYLTLPEHCPAGTSGGTHLYRHRPTGSDRAPYDEQELSAMGFASPEEFMERVLNADTNDPEKWEELCTVPIRFNRLLLFRPQQYHSAGYGFGTSKENGRLVYVNSYNNADTRRM